MKKNSSKKMSEQDIEIILDDLMQIFRYLLGKDIFEAFYCKKLAKRLLLERS